MAADGHEAAPLPPHEALEEGEVDDGPHVVLPVGVLGDPHAPDEDGPLGPAHHLGEGPHLLAGDARRLLQLGEGDGLEEGLVRLKARGVGPDEPGVYPALLQHPLGRPVEEGDVPAGEDLEEAVGDPRAEEGAFQVRGDEVALHPGLPVGVHHRHLGPRLFGVVEVLHHHRLVVGHVGAQEDHEVGADEVGVAAGGGRHPKGLLEDHGGGEWQMRAALSTWLHPRARTAFCTT